MLAMKAPGRNGTASQYQPVEQHSSAGIQLIQAIVVIA